MPSESIPDLVPAFVIEVMSLSNTRGEMSRTRREDFHAGVRLMWIVDPRSRTVAVFRSPEDVTVVGEDGQLDGADVPPNWAVNLAELFARLDRAAPPAE